MDRLPQRIIWMFFCVGILSSNLLYSQNLENLKDQDVASFSGSVQFSSQFYRTNQLALSREPLSYVLSGSPTISIYGISIPFNFTYSNSDLNYQHPFNQYGIAPSYKWAKALIGYNSVSYSKYVLRGLRIKGVGVELNPGKFRMAAFRGTLRKAVDYDLEPTGIGDFNYNTIPAYHQSGYGIKLGFGSSRSYIDLSILKAKDNPESIMVPDSINNPLPIEGNTAIGLSSQIKFSKHVTLKIELGLTAFTNNQEADSVNISNALAKTIVEPLYTPNESSQYLTALETDLKFKFKKFSPSINYTRIDRDYRSLGSYSRVSDIERIKIKAILNPSKKIKIGGSLGIQRNDINDVNALQNKRFINAFNVTIKPSKSFFVTGQYSNFGVTRAPRIDVTNDTIRYKQSTRNISISPTFISATPDKSHTLSLNLATSALQSEIGINDQASSSNLTGNINYSLSLIKIAASIGASVNYLKAEQQIPISTLGYTVFGSKSFANRQLQVGANASLFNSKSEGSKIASIYRFGGNFSYTINQSSALSFNLSWIRNDNTRSTLKPMQELLGNIMFNYQFLQNEK